MGFRVFAINMQMYVISTDQGLSTSYDVQALPLYFAERGLSFGRRRS